MLNAYTVVLLRPERISDKPRGQDIYVALIDAARSPTAAILIAQKEAAKADKRRTKPEEYKLCVLFEGKHEPKLFGWQV